MLTHARDSAETAFCHVIPIATLLLFLPMLSVTSAAVFLWSPTPLPTNVALMVKVTEHVVLMLRRRASSGLQQREQVACFPLLGVASFPSRVPGVPLQPCRLSIRGC